MKRANCVPTKNAHSNSGNHTLIALSKFEYIIFLFLSSIIFFLDFLRQIRYTLHQSCCLITTTSDNARTTRRKNNGRKFVEKIHRIRKSQSKYFVFLNFSKIVRPSQSTGQNWFGKNTLIYRHSFIFSFRLVLTCFLSMGKEIN